MQRSTQSGYVREAALEGLAGFGALVRLENAVFQPIAGCEIGSLGAVSICFLDARTLRITTYPVGRRVSHGVPLAVFGTVLVRLRNVRVLVDDAAIALVGEMTQTRLPGEWSLSLQGASEICHLPPTASSRPFAFPLAPAAPSPAANAIESIATKTATPPLTPRRRLRSTRLTHD